MIYSYTYDKSSLKKSLNFAFVPNLVAMSICYPLSLVLCRLKFLKSVKLSLVLCLFSMANDLFIEFRRKKYISMNFTEDELKTIKVEKNIIGRKIRTEYYLTHIFMGMLEHLNSSHLAPCSQ